MEVKYMVDMAFVTCQQEEGIKSCSWYWGSHCNNPSVQEEIRKLCSGKMERPIRNGHAK